MKLTLVHPLQDIPPAHSRSHSRLNSCPFFQALYHPSITITVSLSVKDSAYSRPEVSPMFRNSAKVAKKTTSDGKVFLGLEDDRNAGTQTGTSSLTVHARDLRGVKMGTPVPARSQAAGAQTFKSASRSQREETIVFLACFCLASQSEGW